MENAEIYYQTFSQKLREINLSCTKLVLLTYYIESVQVEITLFEPLLTGILLVG